MTTGSDSGHEGIKNRGFTLLEVMISVSILSIGFLAIYSLFIQSVAASGAARFNQQAASLATLKQSAWAQGAAEFSRGELSRDEGDFGDDYPGWRWRLEPSPVESEEFDTVAKRLTRVRLEVFHEGDARIYGVTHYLFVTEEK